MIPLSNSYFGANIIIARFIMAPFNSGALYHGAFIHDAFIPGALIEYDRNALRAENILVPSPPPDLFIATYYTYMTVNAR